MPIYEGYSLPDVFLCLDLVGHDLSEHHQFYCHNLEAENSNVKLVDHPNIIKLEHEHFEARPTPGGKCALATCSLTK